MPHRDCTPYRELKTDLELRLVYRGRFEMSASNRSHARQTSVFDARYQGISRIEYPLHPLFGCEGSVLRQVRYEFQTCVEINIDQKTVSVARWMTRSDLCKRLTCGHDPIPDWDSLLQILRLFEPHTT